MSGLYNKPITTTHKNTDKPISESGTKWTERAVKEQIRCPGAKKGGMIYCPSVKQ